MFHAQPTNRSCSKSHKPGWSRCANFRYASPPDTFVHSETRRLSGGIINGEYRFVCAVTATTTATARHCPPESFMPISPRHHPHLRVCRRCLNTQDQIHHRVCFHVQPGNRRAASGLRLHPESARYRGNLATGLVNKKLSTGQLVDWCGQIILRRARRGNSGATWKYPPKCSAAGACPGETSGKTLRIRRDLNNGIRRCRLNQREIAVEITDDGGLRVKA